VLSILIRISLYQIAVLFEKLNFLCVKTAIITMYGNMAVYGYVLNY